MRPRIATVMRTARPRHAGILTQPRARLLLRAPLVVPILLVAWLAATFLVSLHLPLRHVEATMLSTVAKGQTVHVTGTTICPPER